uniref:Uncharacterized protein n=1 Tax=Rhizophora mucronata TaxID=61149 RepID=A0A2P2JHV6_RHIMU
MHHSMQSHAVVSSAFLSLI